MGSYFVTESVRKDLADRLYDYYTAEFDAGVRALMDRVARSNMGVGTAYLDMARDGWASLTAESRDKFTVKFETAIRQQAMLAYAGWPDLIADAIPQATKALTALCDKIPVPGVSAVISGLMNLAAGAAVEELRAKAIADADERVTAGSGAVVRKVFSKPEDVEKSVTAAMEQYKLIGRYMTTMPKHLATVQDVVTFPKSVFKVRQAASALNVELLAIRDYIESMQTRLEAVQTVYRDYEASLKSSLPASIDAVLEQAYQSGYEKGTQQYRSNAYKPIGMPSLQTPRESGGATHLAAHVAYANALGYFDVGQYEQVNTRRGRASAISSHTGPVRSVVPASPASSIAPALPGGITPRRR